MALRQLVAASDRLAPRPHRRLGPELLVLGVAPELGEDVSQLTPADGLPERAQHCPGVHASFHQGRALALGHHQHELPRRVAVAVSRHVLQHWLQWAGQLAGQVPGLLLAQALAQDREHRLGGHLGGLSLQAGFLRNVVDEFVVLHLGSCKPTYDGRRVTEA